MNQQNQNSGALFKNLKKIETKNTSWPDYSGSIQANGTDYWLSAWLKKDKNGKSYFSLALTPKETSAAQTPSTPQKPLTSHPSEEEVPF